MNEVNLMPGEAVQINAGVPHCYISGECIEAMACSDNVIRAGLTSKYKDVSTLLDLLNYDLRGPPEIILGTDISGFITYKSDYSEFQVRIAKLQAG